MSEEEVFEGTDFDPDVDAIAQIDAYLEGDEPVPGDTKGDDEGNGQGEVVE